MAMTTSNAQPNVTPLIDVLLTLLVIFMVITPVAPKGETAVVPRPTTSPTPAGIDTTVVVQVLGTEAGAALKINGENVTWQGVQARLTDIFKTRANRVLFVTADELIPWEDVTRVVSAGHAAGVDKIALLPRQPGMER